MLDLQQLYAQVLDYIKGIWIKKRYILLTSWVICPLGFAYIVALPDTYSSSARVHVDTRSMLAPLLRGLIINPNQSQEISLIARTLKSRENLERIARETDLDITVIGPGAFDELISQLGSDIKIGSGGRSNIFNISFKHENPNVAKNVVQETLNLLIETSLGKSRVESDSAYQFLQQQIDEYEQRLIEAEMRVADFKRKYSDILPETGSYYSRLKAAESNLNETNRTIREVESQIESLKSNLQLMQSSGDQGSAGSLIPTRYDARIQSLENKLDELKLRFTDEHPDVIEAKSLLSRLNESRDNEIKSYIASLENATSMSIDNPLSIDISQLESQLASLNIRKEDFETKILELETKIDFVPQLELEQKSLNRNYGIIKAKYEELLSRQDSAELGKKADISDDDLKFRVISPPTMPRQPSGPNRILLYTGVLVFGFVSGLGLAFLLSQFSPVLMRAQQLSSIVNIPVYGSVANIDARDIKRRNSRNLFIFLLSSSILLTVYASLVLATLLNINIYQRFIA
jgi:polysaccharide chain length determinant protein (PEP-CTERM system associated)|tara:strand:- start:2750 stop:4303 length:1554 start_codon:yes stop_codon:yes gene_type:complete